MIVAEFYRRLKANDDCNGYSAFPVFGIILNASCLGIAKLVIASLYFDECELQRLLPIYVIVDASVQMSLLPVCAGIYKNEINVCHFFWCIPIGFFLFSWLIAGTVWVEGVRQTIYFTPSHCHNVTTCVTCSQVLTDFSLFAIIINWFILAMVLACLLVCAKRFLEDLLKAIFH